LSAKEIVLRPISRQQADAIVRRHHYSGISVNNTQINIGVYYRSQLEGAMQFGPPLDRRKLLGIVRDTPWEGMVELNRMAFSDNLPRNSESRALAIAMKLVRKHKPAVQWVVSFADATQCGDGAIYRAAGFVLTLIKPSDAIYRLPDGTVIHKMTLHSNPTQPRPELGGKTFFELTGGKYSPEAYLRATGAIILPGFQLRYLYFLDPTARQRLTVPVVPFEEIARLGASMYKGQRTPRAGSADSGTPGIQPGGGGAHPTPALLTNPQVCEGQP